MAGWLALAIEKQANVNLNRLEMAGRWLGNAPSNFQRLPVSFYIAARWLGDDWGVGTNEFRICVL